MNLKKIALKKSKNKYFCFNVPMYYCIMNIFKNQNVKKINCFE